MNDSLDVQVVQKEMDIENILLNKVMMLMMQQVMMLPMLKGETLDDVDQVVVVVR